MLQRIQNRGTVDISMEWKHFFAVNEGIVNNKPIISEQIKE